MLKQFMLKQQLLINQIGCIAISYINSVGEATCMLFNALVCIPDLKKGFPRLLKQIYFVGVLSLIIIILSGVFIGMVLGVQGYTILVKFGAEQALGQMIALSLVRSSNGSIIVCREGRISSYCRNWFDESDRAVIFNGNDWG